MIDFRIWQIAGWTMLHYLWVGAVVGVVAAAVRLLLRSREANLRYLALGCFAVLGIAPLPIALVVSIRIPSPPRSEPLVASEHVSDLTPLPPRVPAIEIFPEPAATAPPVLSSPPPAPAPRPSELLRTALDRAAMGLPWLWLIGAPLTFLLTTIGLLGAERLRRHSRLVEDSPIAETCRRLAAALGVSRRVSVAICDRIAAPVLLGIFRPLILLPAVALTGWDAQQLEMVLLHELAHVRRWDNLVNLMQRVVESLLFFHPLVWIVSAWVRREREHCCDGVVVARTQQPRAYAEMLVGLSERISQGVPRRPSLPHGHVISSMAERPLVARIRRILKKEEQSMQVSRKTVGLVLAGLIGVALVIGGYCSRAGDARDTPVTSKNDNTPGELSPTAKPAKDGRPENALAHADKVVDKPAAEIMRKLYLSREWIEKARSFRIHSEYKTTPTAEGLRRPAAAGYSGKPDPRTWRMKDEWAWDESHILNRSQRHHDGDAQLSVVTTAWNGSLAISCQEPEPPDQKHYGLSNKASQFFEDTADMALLPWGPGDGYHFWWLARDAAKYREGNFTAPDDFELAGQENVGGKRCHMLQSRAGLVRLYIGVADGRLYRREILVSHDWKARQLAIGQKIGGASIKTLKDWWNWWGNLKLQDRIRAYRSFQEAQFERARVWLCQTFDDYREVAPGCWLSFRQIMDTYETDSPEPFLEGHAEQTIADVTLNQPLPQDLFHIDLPEGAKVATDWRYDPPIDYTYRKDQTEAQRLALRDAARPPGYQPNSETPEQHEGAVRELKGEPVPAPKTNDQPGKTSDAKSASQITIAGQCLDDQSQPIANAKVFLYRAELMDPLTQPLLVQSVQTGRDGKFRFTPVADLNEGQEAWKRSLPQGAPYFVLAKASGKATESVFVPQHLLADSGFDADAITATAASTMKLSVETGNLKLRMPHAAILSGIVTGPDGKPVKGALVCGDRLLYKSIPGANGAITDSAGKYEIRDLPTIDLTKPPKGRGPFQMKMPLDVRCPGFADKQVDYSKVPGTVDAQLELAAVIQGRIVNGEDNRPAAGVRVQFQGTKDGGKNSAFGIVETDAAGRYRFDSLGAGKYNIWAEKDGYTMRALDSVEAVPGTTTAAADIRLIRGGFIAGHVIDADTGRPFFPADAAASPWFRPDVALYGPSRPQSGPACDRALIQPDGSFRLRAAPGSNHVYLRIYDLSQAVPPAAMDVDVAEGQTVKVDFKVRRKAGKDAAVREAKSPTKDGAKAEPKPSAKGLAAEPYSDHAKGAEPTAVPGKVISDPIAIAAKLTEIRDVARRNEKRLENIRIEGTFEPNHEQFLVVVRDGKYRHDREVVLSDDRRVKSYWLDDGKTSFSFSENLLVMSPTLGDARKLEQNLPAHLHVYLTPQAGPIGDRNLSVSQYCDALLAAMRTEAFGKNSVATLRLRETGRRTVISIEVKPENEISDEIEVALDAYKNYAMTRYWDRSRAWDRMRQNDVRSEYREIAPGVFFLSKGTWWQKASGKTLEEAGEAHEGRMSIAIDSVEIDDFSVSDTFFDVHHWPPIKLGINVDDNRVKPPLRFVYDKGPFDATVLRQPLRKERSEPDAENKVAPPKSGNPAGKTSTANPATDLLREFKEEKVFWKQSEIARKLIAAGDKRVVPEIVPMLASADRQIRCNAGLVLAGLDDERGLPAVLAEFRDTSDRPGVWTPIRGDGAPNVAGQIVVDRCYAAQVLEKIGDGRAVPALIEALQDKDIECEAAIALAHLGDQRAVPALLAVLDLTNRVPPTSINGNMKFWAGYALMGLGHPLGSKTLREFLDDEHEILRRYAADAFAEFPDKVAVPLLIRATADNDKEVRVNAIAALGKIGDEAALPTLRALLRDSDEELVRARQTFDPPFFKKMTVREAAAHAIKQIESR